MKTDIQIAQEATLQPIKEVAATIGIEEEDLELYGKYKAKISDELIARSHNNPDGKLILVTAINPTPAGEGKTTVTVGLGQAFAKLGKKAMIALREPSLGPCFGIKGGAAGGGYSQVVPMEDFNPKRISLLDMVVQIICWQLFWTTISSREIRLGLIQDRWYGNAVWI